MNLEQTRLGYEIHMPHYTLLMGGKEALLENIKMNYPDVDFVRVKQIHGDGIVESENNVLDYQIVADAHYTRAPRLGLCVITADCVPIFLIHPTSHLIAGIHAGWRGVASRILPKTIARLHAEGAPNHEIHAIIGPHIQKDSFEVGFEVRDQILNSVGQAAVGNKNTFFENIGDGKALIDLNQVVKEQLLQEGIPSENVHDLHLDTYTNPLFHSHRRDKDKAGRQISFIYRHD